MGIYVNPGNTAFREALNSAIYIDKTGLIAYTNKVLNTKQKNLCVSRPRRFGKSIAADMLSAYYSKGCNSHALFSDLIIKEQKTYPEHLNQHQVIRLDIQRFLETKQDLDTFISEIERKVILELIKEFPDCNHFGVGSRLKGCFFEEIFTDRPGIFFLNGVRVSFFF